MEAVLNGSFDVLAGLGVLLGFGVLVFVHELGHFLAAKGFGFQIDVFSIGFGPALWKRRVNGVEYKIGCIPFGGYVALPQLDPSGMEKIQGGADASDQALPSAAPWKRIVVSFAGPLGNVLLAIVLAYFIYWMPSAKTGAIETRVGTVEEKSAAWNAGLRNGDRILFVNGQAVNTWSDLNVESVLSGASGKAKFKVARQGREMEFEIPLTKHPVYEIQMLEGVYPETPCIIEQVNEGTPAALAGIQPGDVLKNVNGVPVFGVAHFISLISKNGAAPVEIGLQRAGKSRMVALTPYYDETLKRAIMGVAISGGDSSNAASWMMYRDPWQQLQWDSLSVLRFLKGLIAPKQKGERAAIAANIGGPPMILMSLFSVIKNSLMDTIGFLRMLCMNLAILNLLPLPILDGGHIVFAVIEIITRRKPHPKVVSFLSNFFAVLLIGLMLFLSFRDIAGRVKRNRMMRSLEAQKEQVESPATK